jgi:hypothetical protein
MIKGTKEEGGNAKEKRQDKRKTKVKMGKYTEKTK